MKATRLLSGVIAIVGALACGDKKSREISLDAAGASGGIGGGRVEAVGTGGIAINLSSVLSNDGAVSHGGTVGTERDSATVDMGAAICGCGFSGQPSCDQFTLWDAVKASAVGTVGGYCIGAQGMVADSATAIVGTITLDSEGRVVDNTVFGSAQSTRRKAWLDSLEGYRWPCLAAQIIPFTCESGYE